MGSNPVFVLNAVRLAAGMDLPAPVTPNAWPSVLEVAKRERIAALAWMRSGERIRRSAPFEVTTEWRRFALETHAASQQQSVELLALASQFAASGAHAIAVKGPAMAAALYGTANARLSSDLDFFVPVYERAACHRALLESGWQHCGGIAPGEAGYRRKRSSGYVYLELHSRLLDDPLVGHVELPAPRGTSTALHDGMVSAYWEPALAVFLAVHLAKHRAVPLLWWLDFATLWALLEPSERDEARSLAARTRCAGYLRWAEAGVGDLDGALQHAYRHAEHRIAALQRRHSGRAVLRVAALAEGWNARFVVVGRWALGRAASTRIGRRLLLGAWASSLARIVRTAIPTRRSNVRRLEVSPAELVGVVQTTTSAGDSLWIRARGTSMEPAIPSGALVRVAPLPPGCVVPGDVVFALLGSEDPVLHRVVSIENGAVLLKGDNVAMPDRPVEIASLIGVVDAVNTGRRQESIAARPRRSLRAIVSRWRKALGQSVGREVR